MLKSPLTSVLNMIKLVQTGSNWIKIDQDESDWLFGQVGSNQVGSNWFKSDQSELNEIDWIKLDKTG